MNRAISAPPDRERRDPEAPISRFLFRRATKHETESLPKWVRVRGEQVTIWALLLFALSAGGSRARGADNLPPAPPSEQRAAKASESLNPWLRDLRGEALPARVAAADALGRMGAAAVPAIPAMLEAMSSPEAWVMVAMMDGIKAMGPSAHPTVLDLFERGTGEQRFRAGMVLWAIGLEAQAAVPRVKKQLEDPDPKVRELAAMILEKIDEELAPDRRAATTTTTTAAAASARARLPQLRGGAPLTTSADTAAADWPGFLGPNRDSLCTETGLLKHWPEGGPKLLWKVDGLGRGFSAVSIASGRLLTMGDRTNADSQSAQFVIALDLNTRKELWSTRVGPPHPDGGPRCTPTIDGLRTYALGTDGDLVCLETATGNCQWRKNLTTDLGGHVMSGWKYCESPLVDGPKLICTPGAEEAALVALDKQTGAVLWKSAVPELGPKGKDGAGYASPMVAEIEGVRQYVQVLGRGVVGVDAGTGKFLWGYNKIANNTANIPNPVIRGNLVFVANGYNAGSALLRIRRQGDRFSAEEVYFLKAKEFDNHHGGIVLVGDSVYGGVGLNKGDPACIDFATGETRWKVEAPSSGSASVVYADGHLVFRYDRGLVLLVAADPQGFRSEGQFMAVTREGPAWAHPVIHQRRLYLRHNDLLACYDLSAHP